MLRCVVVDDEAGAVEVLRGYIERTPGLETAAAFRSAVDAQAWLANHGADIAFLDIGMPELNGLELAGLIDRRRTLVVFCTAYSEYAAESYERDAVDYLLKPVSFERFLKAVAKVLGRRDGAEAPRPERGGAAPRELFVKSGAKIHRLDPRSILWIEKDGHYVVFHTAAGELLSRMNMEELLESLPAPGFVRVHKSYVVALDKIDTIDRDFVTVGERDIPIGESFRGALLRRVRSAGD
jgi:DNA-binding LytR/AlgR family response regulator